MNKLRFVGNEAIILLEDTYEESLLHLPHADLIRFIPRERITQRIVES